MKAITMYQAEDGTRYEGAEQCAEYEKLLGRCASALAILPSPSRKLQSEEYFQLPSEAVTAYTAAAVEIFIEYFRVSSETAKELRRMPACRVARSVIGRFVGDSGVRCLGSLLSPMSVMDSNGRMWEQPYFAARNSWGGFAYGVEVK